MNTDTISKKERYEASTKLRSEASRYGAISEEHKRRGNNFFILGSACGSLGLTTDMLRFRYPKTRAGATAFGLVAVGLFASAATSGLAYGVIAYGVRSCLLLFLPYG